jgi:choline dehydrogenase
MSSAEVFDYIVVGGGSSGAVVAARLSEDPSATVLLLEAGKKSSNLWLRIPLGFGKVYFMERFGWGYATDPEPELNGRSISCPRGKVLGGSSAINGLVYIRGTPVDYSIWQQAGATGWSYDEVLPFYRKSERQQRGPDEFHGATGPLGVEDPGWHNTLADAFIEAAVNSGLPRNPDFNGPSLSGAGYYQLNTWKGVRSSSAAYLASAKKNLKIETESLVCRVDVQSGVAEGVFYKKAGKIIYAKASKEVILSAGAFNTPKILQLSGIGPAALLRGIGIDVKVDLAGVGENLSDHFTVARIYQVAHDQTLNVQLGSLAGKARALFRFLAHRDGPLTIGGALAGAFTQQTVDMDAPEFQLFYGPFGPSMTKLGALAAESSITLCGYLNRPQSRGVVKIRSTDPEAKPSIMFNYISSPHDLQRSMDLVNIIGNIASSNPLRQYITREVTDLGRPGSAEDLQTYVRSTGSTSFHPVGTCKMGSDAMAVVDPTLKVLGVERLRVADASVMPTVISGNTNAACIMIGERCADFIARQA